MATDSGQTAAFTAPLSVPLDKAQDSCENAPVVPDQECTMVILMAPKRTRSGMGRIVNRARATPEPIVEFEVQ